MYKSLSQILQLIFWWQKFVGREERQDFFMEYYPLHTAEQGLSQKVSNSGENTFKIHLIF